MFGKNEHIDRLKAISLFSTLNKKELTAIDKAADEVTFEAGQALITEGELGSEAYILIEGSVTVMRNGRKIAKLGEGAVIGEYALLNNAPRVATVICDTDCTLLMIGRREFTALLESTPALSIKFLQELATRLRDLDRAAYD